MWSIGIITYFLLTGRNPLPAQLMDPQCYDTEKIKIPYPRRYWSTLSLEAKSFVEGLLQVDPTKRMTGNNGERLIYSGSGPTSSLV